MLFGFLFFLIVAVSAQRPYYAGASPIGVPQLASRFQDQSASSSVTSSTTASQSSSSSLNTNPNVVNRNGGTDSTTSTTVRLPVDARGDAELVNRISKWPREHQPFWYINAQHIERQRNPQAQGNTDAATVSLPK